MGSAAVHVQLRPLQGIGVDPIDCSSGGFVPYARIPAGPGYQTPFATEIRARVGIATGAVGLITQAMQAEQIVATGQADVVIIAREKLATPTGRFMLRGCSIQMFPGRRNT